MWSTLFGNEAQRKRLLKHTPAGPLHEFYSHAFPDPKTPINDVPFVVLDFETTGLDIKKHHIVSIGLVEIKQLGILLNTTWHQLVKTSHDMPQDSAVIHQITDDMVAQGLEFAQAMAELLPKLQGKVLIAHHAPLEYGLLNQACQALYQQRFVMPTVDTLVLGKRRLQRQHEVIHEGALRLFNLRERYNLPVYKAHNALSDALATAELFLALVNDLYPALNCRLNDVLTN